MLCPISRASFSTLPRKIGELDVKLGAEAALISLKSLSEKSRCITCSELNAMIRKFSRSRSSSRTQFSGRAVYWFKHRIPLLPCETLRSRLNIASGYRRKWSEYCVISLPQRPLNPSHCSERLHTVKGSVNRYTKACERANEWAAILKSVDVVGNSFSECCLMNDDHNSQRIWSAI